MNIVLSILLGVYTLSLVIALVGWYNTRWVRARWKGEYVMLSDLLRGLCLCILILCPFANFIAIEQFAINKGYSIKLWKRK